MKFLPLALTILSIGIILVIIPDSGKPVIRFSDDHGPGLLDLVGLTLILLVWLMLVFRTWRRRRIILETLGPVTVGAVLTLIAICSFLIPLGLKIGNDALLFGSSIVNVVCQVVLFSIALRREI